MRALLLSLALAAPASAQTASTRTATELADMANKVLRGESSHARLTMSIQTPSWSRSLEVEGWNQGRVKAFIVIHNPPKERGTTTLRRGAEMWMWMPKVERLLKVPPSMMHSSWQGSDFTYEDIVKADSIVKDYTHKVVKTVPGPEYETDVLEATPKPDAPVVWGKILFSVGVYPDGWVIPLREEDYSERGELIRTITLGSVKAMGGRRVPTRLTCEPTRTPGRKTTLDYSVIEFDVDLKDSFFSLSRLQK